MGQKMTTSTYIPPKGEEGMILITIAIVNRNRFDFLNIIGRGGFGKVWKVIDKKSKATYALKEMQKVKVIDKKSENSIKYERELLSRLKHPFIVNMYYAFQDYDHLYLVMDLLNGGDLRYHVSRHKRFTEEQTKFFIACIVTALDYIHTKSVIHRDIKPENLVLDDKGYVRVTDFGIAKVLSKSNANETSGTPGYMSPEVMRAQPHTFAVDYFAVGIIGHEFMLGKRPYAGKSRKEIKEQMMAKQAVIREEDIPQGWSLESADFFNKLLLRKQEVRLGFNGFSEVKDHPWFNHYPWADLYSKKLSSPFVPDKRDNYDKRYCEAIEKLGMDTKGRYEQYKLSQRYEHAFHNFTFYNVDGEEVKPNQEPTSVQYEKCDYSKRRCQSALSNPPNYKEREVNRGKYQHSGEVDKENSKANIISNKPPLTNTLHGSAIKLSSNYNSNNYTVQKAKTMTVYHQYQPIQNKIPLPNNQKHFMKSISSLGVSPYSTKNSKKTTEDSSLSAFSMLKTGSASKHLRTGSFANRPNTATTTKAPLGLQRSSSNYGFYAMKNHSNGSLSQINQANMHSTIDNRTNVNVQKIYSNMSGSDLKGRLVASASSAALFKNYQVNNYSLSSTGGSTRSKIVR